MKKLVFLGCAAMLASLASECQAGFVIDDFSEDQAGGTTESIILTDLSPVTADRTLSLVGGTGSFNLFNVSDGMFFFAQGSGSNIADTTLTLLYDNFSTGTIDLTQGGASGFELAALDYTNNGDGVGGSESLALTITVTAPTSSSSITILQPQNNMDVFVSFASFAPSFNFASVTSINLEFFVPSSSQRQITFDSLAAVPEPTSMAIMGLGTLLAGFGVRRRKRKMAELVA